MHLLAAPNKGRPFFLPASMPPFQPAGPPSGAAFDPKRLWR